MDDNHLINNKKSAGHKFLAGTATLAITGLVIKLLGAFFRIPLTNLIGEDGMAYYGVAYPIYSLFVVLSTTGLPVAISKMVSERVAHENYGGAHKVFRVSIMVLSLIGFLSFLICYFGAGAIAEAVGNSGAELSIKAISPALLIVPIVSSFRGYFQGRQDMRPTAASQLIEQIVRVAVGLSLSFVFIKTSLEAAAAGATFGATAGSVGGLLMIFIIYFVKRKKIHKQINTNEIEYESYKKILKQMFLIAIPITIGSTIMPIMMNIDTAIIMNRLQATGWSLGEATSLFGILSGYCNSLIQFPQVFTNAVAVSIVPAIAASYAKNDNEGLKLSTKLGLRTIMLIGFPSFVGMLVLSKPILLLLYPMQIEGATQAVPTFMILSIEIVFLSAVQTFTGILQGVSKMNIPVINLAIAAAVKLVVTYYLVGIPALNIKGAAIGTVCAFVVACVLDYYAVKKYTGVEFDLKLTVGKPFVSSIIMGLAAGGTYKILFDLLGRNSVATLAAVIVGVFAYFIMIFITNSITREELLLMPMGTKMVKLSDKLHLTKK
ncbi:MAG: polysaccharide biosynthesis protein [Peptostreptococcaceae bacterium]|nr:polysaccharide biosynthesis protein [Peptostreptococcaceae bacterium]